MPVPALQVSYTHDQLLQALYHMFDMFERSGINFYLVGKTGDCAKNKQELSGDALQLAVRKNEWDSGSRRIADAFFPPIAEKEYVEGMVMEYEHNGVPIQLYVLHDSATLTSADIVMYEREYFKLPNPYETFKKEFSWLK